jgi:hypothetical protein
MHSFQREFPALQYRAAAEAVTGNKTVIPAQVAAAMRIIVSRRLSCAPKRIAFIFGPFLAGRKVPLELSAFSFLL